MNALMAQDTRRALGEGAVLCESRTLMLDQCFPHVPANRQTLELALSLPAAASKLESWRNLLLTALPAQPEAMVFGQLRSRLLLHADSDRRPHAGVCLDRLTGVPYIPGNAIKGCARRFALEELRSSAGPKSELLAHFAQVFGGREVEGVEGEGRWSNRGAIRFLPAYPWELLTPDLELEVRTCHHPAYYQSQRAPAADVEEANPEYFPAVAARHLFVFVLLGNPEVCRVAAGWLRAGLATFGLGAKRAAGYGWFDTSEALQESWRDRLRQLQTSEQRRHDQEEAARRRQELERAKRQAEAALKLQFDQLSEEEQEDYRLGQLAEEQLWGKLQNFERHLSKQEQAAMVRALRQSRAPIWAALKERASRGGQWARVEQAIRTACKQAGLGKMP